MQEIHHVGKTMWVIMDMPLGMKNIGWVVGHQEKGLVWVSSVSSVKVMHM